MMQRELALEEAKEIGSDIKVRANHRPERVCADCGKKIQRKAKTGYCRECFDAHGLNKGGGYKPKVKAICFQCKKDWMAEWYQDPVWSRCLKCTAKIRQLDAGVRWLAQWSQA